MSRLAKSTLIIAIFFGLDKVFSLAKTILLNAQFSKAERDIFFASNNIPDLLSALISGGALGMALIPVLSEFLQRDGRKAAWELFSRVLNLAFTVTAAISVIIILLADVLVQRVIAPGFADPGKWALMASLMRLDLAAILIFSISGLVMAGLQANQHFLFPAMAPVMYNLGIITGILILAPENGLQIGPVRLPGLGLGIYGMVYGVIIGAGLHLAIQVPGLIRHGFRWIPKIGLRNPGVLQVLNLMGPRLLTMLCIQSYFIARDRFASFFEEGAISALNNGWFIMQVPETLLGTAIAIALLPSLAEFFARRETDAFQRTVNHALRALLALTLPIAALLAVCIRPLIHIIFRNFDAAEVELTVWATRAFLLGLMGQTWLEIAVRSFYAQQRAIPPLLAAVLQAIAFISLAYLLTRLVGHAGIALADSITFTAEALLLLYLLNRRFPGVLRLGSTFTRALLAAGSGGLLAFLLVQFLPLPAILIAPLALGAGGLVSLPFILPEIKLLIHL